MTLRTGGISALPYDTLNLGIHVGDDPASVAENRRRVRAALQLPAEPAWLEQVHGKAVVNLDAPSAPDAAEASALPPVTAQNSAAAALAHGAAAPLTSDADGRLARRDHAPAMRRPAAAAMDRADAPAMCRADAAVTHRAGPVCAIQVADCMPVLFAARDGSAVGAAHAGWRGLAGGVLEATITALARPASELIVWLGPAISQPNFEVGDEVRAAFIAHDPAAASAFMSNPRGRWQCDLYTLARQRLAALGISHISGGEHCTYADKARFFSYRRDGRCGRMAALIWLDPP
jgi:YfiH family protein